MHNIENNKITKESIYIALVQLLEKEAFEKITITDIAKKAGVSRMSFYRNYDSKMDILTDRLDELFEQYFEEIISDEGHKESFSINFFVYFKNNHELILSMVKANLHHQLHERFRRYLEKLLPIIFDIDIDDIEIQYAIYYIVGGLVNVLIHWIENGMVESVEQMSKIVKNYGLLTHKYEK